MSRFRHRIVRRALPSLVLALSCLLVRATPLFAGQVPAQTVWKRLETPNFELLGNTGERDLRQVAERLEQFRAAMGLLFSGVKQDAAVRTRVLVFRNHKTYDPYKPLYNGKPASLGGYFVGGQDVAHITLTVENLDDNMGVVYHEYVHLLMADAIGHTPLWVGEGLAEYYSSFSSTADRKQVHLGRPHAWHVLRLREEWLPLATLVGAGRDSTHYNERDKQGVFYAESWALMHYLLLGDEQKYAPKAAAFVGAMADGMPLDQACRTVLGIEPAQLERSLRMYVQRSLFVYQTATFTDKLDRLAKLPVTPVSEPQAHAALGDLLWRVGRADDAEAHLARALAADPDLAEAHAALAQLRLRQGQAGQALTHLETATRSERATYLTHFQYAGALAESARASSATPELRAKQEAALRRAIALNPRHADAYHHLAVLKGQSTETAAEALSLIGKATELAPGREDFLLTAAYLHANAQNLLAARAITRTLAARAIDTALRDRARALDDQLDSIDRQQKAAAAASAAHGVPAADAGPALPDTTGPASVIPVLRETQDGELRATGYLVAIECQQSAVRLVVDAQGTPLTFRAARFEQVDFISYRPDLAGAIGCGKRAVLDPVVVTYRPDPTPVAGTAGTVVAIEFVPKGFVLDAK